jgi:hypothetical protein
MICDNGTLLAFTGSAARVIIYPDLKITERQGVSVDFQDYSQRAICAVHGPAASVAAGLDPERHASA